MTLRGLYAITDSQLLAGKLLPYVEAALDGGLTLLQYRDKSNDDARRLREAEALRGLCERYKAHLIINDDASLATAAQAGACAGGGLEVDLFGIDFRCANGRGRQHQGGGGVIRMRAVNRQQAEAGKQVLVHRGSESLIPRSVPAASWRRGGRA